MTYPTKAIFRLIMSDSSTLSFSVLNAYAIRGEDGKLDFDKTVEAFSERLIEFEGLCEKEDGAIAEAVHNVFNTKVAKGGSITMDGIVMFALPALNPTSENYAILRDRIKDWVRINADMPEKKSKDGKTVLREAEPARTRAFCVSKGKGGGVKRWADITEKPVEE